MVCIAQNIHHPQRFLRCKTRNTTHREAVLRDWQRDPVDAGPMWQPELHLLFTVVFKAEKSILRWLLKTEQSVEQVSLCIRYIISPKNPHTFHSEMMEDSTNLCYSFFFFVSPPISLRHGSSPETMEQQNQRTFTWKRKGCLATYSICLLTLLQSHLLGGFSNAAKHRQVGGIHALSSSRQEHSYLKL